MSNTTIKQSVLLKGLSKKTVVAQFDQDHASADGGAVLLKACDERLGLSASLAACLSDNRQPGKVKHSLQELFQQRMFGIACGYADANDAARLAHDPVFKLLIGRDAVDGHDLASQPTLSRFENTVRRRDLLRMSEAVINRHKRRKKKVKLITIDLDPTVDPAHGHQSSTGLNDSAAPVEVRRLGRIFRSSCRFAFTHHLPISTPFANEWVRIARTVGVVPT